MVSEKDLLSEFLFHRTNFSGALPFEKFRKLFPKSIPDANVKEVYGHLRKVDLKTRKGLQKILDEDQNLTTRISNFKSEGKDSVEKVVHTLSSISAVLDEELEVTSECYDKELKSLNVQAAALEDLIFAAEPMESSATLKELMILIKNLQGEIL